MCEYYSWLSQQLSHRGGLDLLRTITIGGHISVQGVYVKTLPDGRVIVRVGQATYSGRPVTQKAA
jgi:hypothetical protein